MSDNTDLQVARNAKVIDPEERGFLKPVDEMPEGLPPRPPGVVKIVNTWFEEVHFDASEDGSREARDEIFFRMQLEPLSYAIESEDGCFRPRWKYSDQGNSVYGIFRKTLKESLGYDGLADKESRAKMIGEVLVHKQITPQDPRLAQFSKGKFKMKNNVDIFVGRPDPGWEKEIDLEALRVEKLEKMETARKKNEERNAGKPSEDEVTDNPYAGRTVSTAASGGTIDTSELSGEQKAAILKFYDGRSTQNITLDASKDAGIKTLPAAVKAGVMNDKLGKQLKAEGVLDYDAASKTYSLGEGAEAWGAGALVTA